MKYFFLPTEHTMNSCFCFDAEKSCETMHIISWINVQKIAFFCKLWIKNNVLNVLKNTKDQFAGPGMLWIRAKSVRKFWVTSELQNCPEHHYRDLLISSSRMTFWTAGDFRGRRDGDFWHPPRVRLKVEG